MDEGVDCNADLKDLKTAFILASQRGDLKIVQYLVESGVDINAVDKYGRTALMHAAMNGYAEVVRCLCRKRS